MPHDVFLSPRQLAERLGISLRTLERMRNSGTGPVFHRVSGGLRRGRVMYAERSVNEWLAQREFHSTVAHLTARG
jgi:hypothetical protein